jgi:hypothetical protein
MSAEVRKACLEDLAIAANYTSQLPTAGASLLTATN